MIRKGHRLHRRLSEGGGRGGDGQRGGDTLNIASQHLKSHDYALATLRGRPRGAAEGPPEDSL